MSQAQADDFDFNFNAPVELCLDDSNHVSDDEDSYFDPDRLSEHAPSPDRIRSDENLAFMEQFGSAVAKRFRTRLQSPVGDIDELGDQPPLTSSFGEAGTGAAAATVRMSMAFPPASDETTTPAKKADPVEATPPTPATPANVVQEAAAKGQATSPAAAPTPPQPELDQPPKDSPAVNSPAAQAPKPEPRVQSASPPPALKTSRMGAVGGARRVAAPAPKPRRPGSRPRPGLTGGKHSAGASSRTNAAATQSSRQQAGSQRRRPKTPRGKTGSAARKAPHSASATALGMARRRQGNNAGNRNRTPGKSLAAAPSKTARAKPAQAPRQTGTMTRERARSTGAGKPSAARRPAAKGASAAPPRRTRGVTGTASSRGKAVVPRNLRAASAAPSRARSRAPPQPAAAAPSSSVPPTSPMTAPRAPGPLAAVTPMAAKGTTASRARAALARQKREAIQARRAQADREKKEKQARAQAARRKSAAPVAKKNAGRTPRRRATGSAGGSTPGYLKQTAAAAARQHQKNRAEGGSKTGDEGSLAGDAASGNNTGPRSGRSSARTSVTHSDWKPRTTVPRTPKLSHARPAASGTGAALSSEELQLQRAKQEVQAEKLERERAMARAAAPGTVSHEHQNHRREVTRPKTPSFGGPKRSGAAQPEAGGYVPLAEQVAKAERGLRRGEEEGAVGAPPRSHAHAPAHPTEPRPFHFQTDEVLATHSAAHEVPLSTEERQVQETRAHGAFRARPFDAASLQQEAGKGVRLVPRRAPTIPQPPKLHTAEREGMHPPAAATTAEQECAAPPQFRARPMPRFDVAPLAGGRGRSVAPLTTPFSPPLASKARAQAKSALPQPGNNSGEGAQEGTGEHQPFKARPAPDYSAVAAQEGTAAHAAPRRLTVPKPFSLATDGRHETSEAAMRRAKEAEEEAARQAREFHARGIMEGVGAGSARGAAHAAPPAPTVPRPFHLQSEALHERAVDEDARRLAAEHEREQSERQFRARPVPEAVLQGPAKQERPAVHKPSTRPSKDAGARRLETRMAQRAAFEAQRQARAEEAARAKAEAEEEAREQEQAEVRRLRREQLRFKARPVPAYLRGAGGSAAPPATARAASSRRSRRPRTASGGSSQGTVQGTAQGRSGARRASSRQGAGQARRRAAAATTGGNTARSRARVPLRAVRGAANTAPVPGDGKAEALAAAAEPAKEVVAETSAAALGASIGGARRIRLRPRKSTAAGVGV